MSYVVPLGIPHSHFLGGPNRWTDLDQDKALAWQRAQRELCGTCKTRDAEWQKDPDAFIGDIKICPGCERLEQEQDNARNLARKGMKIGLVPKELASTGEELFG